MHFYYDKEKPSLSLKMTKKSSKQSHLCSTCTLLRRQVKQLKELQQKLTKEIKLIINYIPRQIDNIITKIRMFVPAQANEKSQSILKPSNTHYKKSSEHRDSLESKTSYQTKLKEEDGIIKQSIYKELKVIRALQSKQKDLRLTNQKHETLRKSLSKESINSNHIPKMRKLQSTPRLNDHSPKSPPQNFILRCDTTDENQWISSPKFGRNNQDFIFQAKIRYSSQDSKPKHKPDREGRLEIQHLKCGNGHQCYKGETLNHLPHGNGTLIICCSKIPFKVNPKTLKYTGSFKQGQFEGKGTLICKDNVKFQGSFSKGMRHGEGVIFLEGSGQKGFWEQDRLVSFI